MSEKSKVTKTPRTPKVHIVLDANALFTDAADKLLATEISNLILTEVKPLGLETHWHIPAVVKAERRHQMLTRGKGLLIPLGKLEALLGHKLAMTEDVLELRVDEAIQRQMHSHGLQDLPLEASMVDWSALTQRAVTKRPPFSPDTEKGFKDAVILETFCQLAGSLPRTAAHCRVVLLTSDKLLREAARERSASWPNVTVAGDLSELRTLLNAVAAHLPQAIVQELVEKASVLFFKEEDADRLWYKWSVGSEIHHRFGNVINTVPEPEFSLSSSQNFIGATAFSEKHGQRVTFTTSVYVESTVTKMINQPVDRQPAPGTKTGIWTEAFLSKIAETPPPKTQLSGNALKWSDFVANAVATTQEVKKVGTHNFRVTWQITLNAKGQITNPSLLDIDYTHTDWDG